MITRIKKIKENDSRPFASAAEKCGLYAAGYVEEEYFIEGLAAVYGRKNGQKVKLYEKAGYCNRIIVRRPKEKVRFSGNILLELMNASYFIDLDRVWALTWRHILRKGDIYIGMTSKPSVLAALKKVNYKRYKELYWSGPQAPALPEECLGNIRGASGSSTEDGLIWDMITDLGKTLKGKDSFLREYGSCRLILSGWSQSGGYMIRYLKDFGEEVDSTGLFDGYFSCGSGSVSMPDLNQNYGQTALKNDRRLHVLRHPFMEIHTESENFQLGNEGSRGENGNRPDYKYRIYDIPGATHDSVDTMTKYYLNDPDVLWAGIVPVYPGKEPRPNDYPYHFIFQRCLEYLYDWVEEGTEPPVFDPIYLDDKGKNQVDLSGNAVGGWRLPQIDYATRTYFPASTPMKPEYSLEAQLFGYVESLPARMLREQYGNLRRYKSLLKKRMGWYVQKGYLLEQDCRECFEDGVKRAAEDGLEELF